MAQLARTAEVLTLPPAHAITMRLLPVNSSAPPTTTRTSPTLKTRPASTRVGPHGAPLVPASATVEKIQRDERTGEDREGHEPSVVHRDLRGADLLGAPGHLGRQQGVERRVNDLRHRPPP